MSGKGREILVSLRSPTYDNGRGSQIPWPLPNLHDEAADVIDGLLATDREQQRSELFREFQKLAEDVAPINWNDACFDGGVTVDQLREHILGTLQDAERRASDAAAAYKRGHNDGYREANKEWQTAPRDHSGEY